jgi:hypothetical protein
MKYHWESFILPFFGFMVEGAKLLLRLIRVLHEYGLSDSEHSARDCLLGWFRDGSEIQNHQIKLFFFCIFYACWVEKA